MVDSQYQKPIMGTITTVNQTVDLTSPNSATSIVEITGTWVGTIIVEGSNDGTTFYTVTSLNRATNTLVTAITTSGAYDANTNGFQFLQVRSSAWTSGSAVISVYGSDAASLINVEIVQGTVNVNLLGLNNIQTSQYTVGTSAVQITPTPLSTRSSISVKTSTTTNTDIVYIGPSNAVTTSNGYALFNGDTVQLDITATGTLWAIATSAGQTVYAIEVGS